MAPYQDQPCEKEFIVVVTDFENKKIDGRTSDVDEKKQKHQNEQKTRPGISIDTVLERYNSSSKSLPLRDTGKVAYQSLAACFFIESAACGLSLAYGVFQEYYTTKFADHRIASWIGVLSEGIGFLGAPLVTYCCQRYALPRQYYLWLGFALCVLGLLCSAFMAALPGLVVTQGLIFGFGILFTDIPLLIVLNTHFDRRRGLAYGIIFAGADLFGVGYTFLITFLLNNYSLRTTMLILTSTIVISAGPPLIFLKERAQYSDVPPSGTDKPTLLRRASTMSNLTVKSATRISPSDVPFSPSVENRHSWPMASPKKRYYQRTVFYIYNLGNVLHAIAFYLPLIYLPTFVREAGHSQHAAATVLAVANIAQGVGDIVFGKLSDKCDVNFLIVTVMTVSSASSFVLWGVFGSSVNGLAVLIAYAFLFGTFGAGFLALWARMGTVFGDRDAQMVYSSLCFGRGVGSIASGPISQALIAAGTPVALRVLGGNQFGGVVMFVGTCLAFGGLTGVFAILALQWRKERAHGVDNTVKQMSGKP